MEKFFIYFLSANLLLVLHVTYFRLVLTRQRRFAWNRAYLLGGLGIALLLPLLRWEVVPPTLPNPSFITMLPEIVIGAPMDEPVRPTWTALEIAGGIYALGVAIALGSILVRNLLIVKLILSGKKKKFADYTLVESSAKIGPASYFRYIFWNADTALDAQNAAVALAHERCHSRQWHTLDLLAVELMKAFCWINPAIYLLRADLRRTHEFLADQAALAVAGPDGIKRLLLCQQLGLPSPAFTHSLYSFIKARIMILTEKSQRKAVLHYAMILPLAGLMAACTSLAHPMDSGAIESTPVTTVSSAKDSVFVGNAPEAIHQQFYNIDDRLLEATLPNGTIDPKAKGMVCMGRMVPTLNLDTTLTLDELENVDNHPYLLNRDRIMKSIGYPEEAKAQKIKDKVLVKILVDETGHVARYSFINNSPAILRDAVELHVKELLFKPGQVDGKPSEWWVIMPFNFGMPGC